MRVVDSVPTEAWRYSVYARFYLRFGLDKRKIRWPIAFGLLPWLLFCFWFWQTDAISVLDSSHLWAVLSASIWMLISPLLMAISERRLGIVLEELLRAPERHGWNLSEPINRLCTANRSYWHISLTVSAIFVIGFLLAQNFITDILGFPKSNEMMLILGSLCMFATGFASGNGVWGIRKILALYSSIDRKSQPAWYPFRYRQIAGYEALSRFALRIGLTFSSGAFFVPITYQVARSDYGFASLLAYIGVGGLLLGSVIVFYFPMHHLKTMGEKTRRAHLEALGDELESYLYPGPFAEFVEKYDEHSKNDPSSSDPAFRLIELLLIREAVAGGQTVAEFLFRMYRFLIVLVTPSLIGVIPPIILELTL